MAFTDAHLFVDDLQEGQQWLSLGRTITEADIVNFAGLSGDFNPIHVDHEFCRTTPFGRPIAHGLLGLAISSGLSLATPPMRTVAFLGLKEWHFREPIFPGDTIRVRTTVLEIEHRARGRRGAVTWKREVLNQHGKVVQEGIAKTLVAGRAGYRAAKSTARITSASSENGYHPAVEM